MTSDVLVLCYHGVSERWPARISISPQRLERQLSYLLERGYRGATFTEAVTAPPARRTLAVTFDDAYGSVFHVALPIMARLGLPGTVFVPTAFIGGGGPAAWDGTDFWLDTPYGGELTPMDWEQLRALVAAGWEIGSHTRTHPRLPELDDPRLGDELAGSRSDLEDGLGGPCRSLAYPYGIVDRRVAEAARAAGYSSAGALLPGSPPGPPAFVWPRVMVHRLDSDERFRRQVTPWMRALQRSGAWPVAGVLTHALRRRPRISSLRRVGARRQPAQLESLRLVARRGRLTRSRTVAAIGALAARGWGIRAYTLWPSPAAPVFILPVGDPGAAAWVRETLDPHGRGRVVDPDVWNALRARALLLGEGPGVIHEAVEAALGLSPDGVRIASFSHSGLGNAKHVCFVFEEGAGEPTAVIKVVSHRDYGDRLRAEIEKIERFRPRLAGAPAALGALPPSPSWQGELRGDWVVVEEVDPLAGATGQEDRAASMGWLSTFHEATTDDRLPWGDADVEGARSLVADAWGRASPQSRDAVVERVDELATALRSVDAPQCGAHGDFWRGNIAHAGGSMRVYDWEWAAEGRRPFFDLWTYELAELRHSPPPDLAESVEPLAAATARVCGQLAARGLDERFALATLVPSIAELTFRIRRTLGRPGGLEENSMRVMAAAERLLLGG